MQILFPRRTASKAILTATVFLLCLRGAEPSAYAQNLGLDVRRFDPPSDPEATLALQPTSTSGAGVWSAGFVSSYARRLLVLDDANGHERAVPVLDQASTDFIFNLAVRDHLSLGLRLPTILAQGGDAVPALGWQLPRSALGDLALDAKATLIPRGPLGGFGVATVARVTAPTGDKNSTVGNSGVTGELRLLGELDWILAVLRVSAGVLMRSERRELLSDSYEHELPWAVGILLRPRALGIDSQGRWQWFVETSGALSLTPKFADGHTSPATFGLGARFAFAKDFSGLMGTQLPLDSAVGVPRLRVVLGITWSPRFADADHDGIPDDLDECPELAGVRDNDGCPE